MRSAFSMHMVLRLVCGYGHGSPSTFLSIPLLTTDKLGGVPIPQRPVPRADGELKIVNGRTDTAPTAEIFATHST